MLYFKKRVFTTASCSVRKLVDTQVTLHTFFTFKELYTTRSKVLAITGVTKIPLKSDLRLDWNAYFG